MSSISCQYTRDEQLYPEKRPQWRLIPAASKTALGDGIAAGISRRDYCYRYNLVQEKRDGNPLEGSEEKVTHNRLTEIIAQPRVRNNQVT
ncbi:hypothetical protein [Enterobacter asburiae]|uniref:hypothetical protein n=1 Tax=Enterobacter asburiae TaxID=61645 RepID=UPI003D6FDE3E